jgi:hypothetical protein
MCVGIWLKRVDCLKVEAEVKLSDWSPKENRLSKPARY